MKSSLASINHIIELREYSEDLVRGYPKIANLALNTKHQIIFTPPYQASPSLEERVSKTDTLH